MLILPAIDIYKGKAVRLYKGDYNEMTVYSENPCDIALDFKRCGAEYIHTVDLEGAKEGTTPNFDRVKSIIDSTGIPVEIGGGIRSLETARKYLDAGAQRVIFGTAAVTDTDMLKAAVSEYGDKIAVGVDIADGYVAIKGWTEKSAYTLESFVDMLSKMGVATLICTDISRDGAMRGVNRELYGKLSRDYPLNIIASGGVSSIDDVRALAEMNLYGAIIGKAYYTGAIDLAEAIEVAKC